MRALFPIDGSEETERSVDAALAMLKGLPGLEVIFLNVRQEGFEQAADPQYVEETFEADEDDEIFPTEASSRRALARCEAVARKHGIASRSEVREGRYRDVVLEEAGKHDLLVMHALGRSNVRAALRGSATEHLARNAPCAVLLAPG